MSTEVWHTLWMIAGLLVAGGIFAVHADDANGSCSSVAAGLLWLLAIALFIGVLFGLIR